MEQRVIPTRSNRWSAGGRNEQLVDFVCQSRGWLAIDSPQFVLTPFQPHRDTFLRQKVNQQLFRVVDARPGRDFLSPRPEEIIGQTIHNSRGGHERPFGGRQQGIDLRQNPGRLGRWSERGNLGHDTLNLRAQETLVGKRHHIPTDHNDAQQEQGYHQEHRGKGFDPVRGEDAEPGVAAVGAFTLEQNGLHAGTAAGIRTGYGE